MMARTRPRPGSAPEPVVAPVVVGPMRRRQLSSVMRIEQKVHPRPWSMGLFLSEMAYGPTRVYVTARTGSKVLGYGGLMLVPDDGHITTLSVDPPAQRHKVATRILLTLARAAIDRGAQNLTLEVRVGNEPAQALYRAFGFAPAGVRKGYYVETGEDALIMWANDIGTDDYAARLAALEAGLPAPTVVEDLT